MKVVLVMFKDGERREFPLKGNRTVIGRRQDAGLRIPTPDVSRQHCEVLLTPQMLTVKDLGSTNGTYVNGKRIAETKLAPADRLAVGPVVFVVQIDGKPAAIKPGDAVSAPPPAAAKAPAPAPKPAKAKADIDEDELFELDEGDLDLEDPISALEALSDDDEDDGKTRKSK